MSKEQFRYFLSLGNQSRLHVRSVGFANKTQELILVSPTPLFKYRQTRSHVLKVGSRQFCEVERRKFQGWMDEWRNNHVVEAKQ